MNEIVNKFLLAGNKFMPEMHLKQTGFTYGASGPFTKNKQRIQKFKETGDTKYIYKNMNMTDTKGGWLLWFTIFLIKGSLQAVVC